MWSLLSPGPIVAELASIEPRLASWDATTHPAQVKLRAYLNDLSTRIGALPDSNLFLHLDVDVGHPTRLLHHYDLENYLTPLVRHLGGRRFVLVSAQKRIGNGSRLIIGHTVSRQHPMLQTWSHHTVKLSGSVSDKRWKGQLRASLVVASPRPLPDGPVEVQLAWRCAPTRNWVNLWKATGDAMGPVLGEPYPGRPFYPNDDRITSLIMHLQPDPSLGHNVTIGLWWRLAAPHEALPNEE